MQWCDKERVYSLLFYCLLFHHLWICRRHHHTITVWVCKLHDKKKIIIKWFSPNFAMTPLGFVGKTLSKRMHRRVMTLVGTVQLAELLFVPSPFLFQLSSHSWCPVCPKRPFTCATISPAQSSNCRDSTQPFLPTVVTYLKFTLLSVHQSKSYYLFLFYCVSS